MRPGSRPGVLNVVHGTGAGAGAPLTGHKDVDRVAFTGSPATAHTVYRDAAAQPDAGVVRARRQIAVHRVRGRGPRRGGGDRRLPVRQLRPGVPRGHAPARPASDPRRRSSSALRRASAEIRVGDPRDPDTTYGPLIHPVALERVTGHVERAFEAGANLAFGGRADRRPLLPPDAVHRCPAGRRDPANRGVRPGAHAADVQRRGRGDRARQRAPTTASPPPSTRAQRAARTGSAPRSSPARCGSTASTCAISRRRSAAPAIRASAARAATTRSTSTRDVKTVVERTALFSARRMTAPAAGTAGRPPTQSRCTARA